MKENERKRLTDEELRLRRYLPEGSEVVLHQEGDYQYPIFTYELYVMLPNGQKTAAISGYSKRGFESSDLIRDAYAQIAEYYIAEYWR